MVLFAYGACPVASFYVTLTMDRPLPTARAQLAAEFTRLLSARGYTLAEQTEHSLRYDRRYCPTLAWLCAVLTFWTVVGLLFLLVRRTDQVIVQLAPAEREGGTEAIISGNVSRDVKRALEELRD